MKKGITESHMQLIVWIVIALLIVLFLVFVAVFYMRFFPFRVTFE